MPRLLKKRSLMTLFIFVRGRRVDKIEPGHYYGATSTVGKLGWIEMNVLPSNDDDVHTWFLFGNATMNESVRMPRTPLEASGRENTTVVLSRARAHSYIRVSEGEFGTVPSSNCWGFRRSKRYVAKLRPVYESFSIPNNFLLTASFHLCWASGNWIVFFGSEAKHNNFIGVSLPVVVKRQYENKGETSSRTAGILDSTAPVRSTLNTLGHMTGGTNDHILRSMPVRTTGATPSPSTVTENASGEAVNKIGPGHYYGATSTAGTLGWIEMNVLLSADDDIRARFVFGNTKTNARVPSEKDMTVALKRESRGSKIEATVGHEMYNITRRNCWALPRHQVFGIMLRRLYSAFSMRPDSQLTPSLHLCWTEGNWVLFLVSRSGCEQRIDELFSPVVMAVKRDQHETSSVGAAKSMAEENIPPLQASAAHHPSTVRAVDWANEDVKPAKRVKSEF